MRKIIHIDMDCFYAAVEIRDNPKLSTQPVAVGGDPGRRGVLCTANYIARRYGVHSAMASAYAMKLCPGLVVLPVDMQKYKSISQGMREIFHQYSDLVEPLSLDEAYIDVSDSGQHHGSATLIAKEIRQKIFTEHRLTASAGVAPNKFLAKIASDWQKPNGLFVIRPKDIDDFIIKLPVEKLFGVGKVTASKLHKLNIKTCLDIQNSSLSLLTEHFGEFGQVLYALSFGKDSREIQTNRVRKSVSVERTFSKDIEYLDDMSTKLTSLINELNTQISKHNRKICKQFVKIKFFDFTVTTVECRSDHIDFAKYQKLLKKGYKRYETPIRLLGVGVGFVDDEQQEEDCHQLSLL